MWFLVSTGSAMQQLARQLGRDRATIHIPPYLRRKREYCSDFPWIPGTGCEQPSLLTMVAAWLGCFWWRLMEATCMWKGYHHTVPQ